MKFLKLIGFENLIILAFAQFIFKYGFLNYQEGLFLSLNDVMFSMLIWASVLITAGGFLINNITANGSQSYGLSDSSSYYIYAALTIAGLVMGYFVCNAIGRPEFLMVFGIPAATMYFYASNLRQSLLLGNLIVALLSGLGVLIVGILGMYPVAGTSEPVQLATVFGVIIDFSIFIVVVSFAVTLVNDLKNTDEDYNAGLNTLPIAIGKARAAKIAFAFGIIAVGMLLYYINTYLKELVWAMGFILLLVLGPLAYFLINIWSAKTSKEFTTLEVVLKAILFFAAASVAVITYNIQNHA
ncbi:hypothetical protein AMR72_01390 [Flavobacterium psychrophilum]|nr:hypothetical protein AMR72_01390 [Flavobacterium psychrophilum]AOE51291.1 hypothetical protein ALW18_01390 [Flavobacterium psychrophilum]